MSRRRLVQMGMAAAVAVVVGCGDSGAPTKVETPATEGGARLRLDKMKAKAEQAATRKKK